MQRINKIDIDNAPARAAELLSAVKASMGGVPNIFSTMAQSATVLDGYLGFSGTLGKGVLSNALREQIALATANVNGCDYCASAHTVLGGNAGLSAEEAALNLRGQSNDPKTQQALLFVQAILDSRGQVSDRELAAIRMAGFCDEEIIEIVANVALNIFTNYFNNVAGTEVDFPVIKTTRRAA